MKHHQNPFHDLLQRGVQEVVPAKLAEEKLKSGKPLKLYLGIDPTGSKLHLGHSVPLRKLKQFSDAGHQVVFLVGSFTAMIGDPSGRDAMREPLTRTQVEENFADYKRQSAKILDYSKIEIRYNHEWLELLKFEDIIGLASHFTVQQMLERDMYEKRMKEGNPIALHEFLYPLMVGYDSVVLDVDCEVGGSDQLFNMLAGRHLQTVYGKKEKFVLTTKLIEGTDGRKMSKTYNNCIYLDDSAKEMYGKVLSIKDELILIYMECCTDIPLKEIETIEKEMKDGANPRDAKMRLAREIVSLYHSSEEGQKAEEEFISVFQKKQLPKDIPEITMPQTTYTLIDLLTSIGLAASKSDARRLIEGGGVRVDEQKVEDPALEVALSSEKLLIQVGKRKFMRVSKK